MALDRVLEFTALAGTLIAAEAYTEYREIVESDKAAEIDRRVVFRMMGGKRMSAKSPPDCARGERASGIDEVGGNCAPCLSV